LAQKNWRSVGGGIGTIIAGGGGGGGRRGGWGLGVFIIMTVVVAYFRR